VTGLRFPQPVAGVIFDMDGLLLDTERLTGIAVREGSRALGFEMPEAFYHSMIGVPAMECAGMILRHFGPDYPILALEAEIRTRMMTLLAGGIPIKPGALELLDFIAARRWPKAVATSASRHVAALFLGGAGLVDRFDAIVTRDDVTRGKPDPEPFLTAAARLGIRPDACIVLEDAPAGIRAAHAAGTMPIMVPDAVQPDAEIRALCLAVAADLHEVRGFLAAHIEAAA
jgi:HAD superfamily hydrolase (TIGR01509 family)